MPVLIIAEHHDQTLKQATLHAISAGKKLADVIDVLIVGHACQKQAQVLQRFPLREILIADHPCYAHTLAENSASLIAEVAKNYQYVVAPATTFGKNLLPRVAALMDLSMVSDVSKILSKNQFERPIYAGNVIATVKTDEPIKLLTVRTTAFQPIESGSNEVPIRAIDRVIDHQLSRFENELLTQSKRPELTTARVVVAGGRGLKSAENFHLLEQIADRLGGAVAASRAAVDAGYAPNDYQVGQTGKVVAPGLYFAVGISGAIQHLAGMKDSKVIVAINQDPDAPIMQMADYVLVGDLFKILPELQAALDHI